LIIAAYDFGTTGCKASFFKAEGKLVATAYEEYPTYYPRSGWVEQDPADWKNALVESTLELFEKSKVKPKNIACLSFSGHMMGCIPVDKRGNPLTNRCMLWADHRSKKQAKRIIESIGWDRFYLETGAGLDVVLYPAAKIPWIRENQPELYRKASKFIGTKDVISAWLTCNIATDFSEASDSGLLNLKNRDWHRDFIKAFGINHDKMPQLLPSTAVVGRLSSDAARLTGFFEGTPVVIGGGDVPCGTAGAGAVKENLPYICVGSAGWISVARKEPIIDLSARPMSLCHVVPDLYTSQVIMYSAGIAYKWSRDEIFTGFFQKDEETEKNSESFDSLNKLAGTSPAGARGVLFLPYLRPGGAPHYDLYASGAFLGLRLTNKKADLIRAVLEGVVLNFRIMMKCIEQSCSFSDVRIIGGVSKSALWRQVFADVLKKNIISLSAQQEANTLGAAVVGGVGAGLFNDFSAIERFVKVKSVTSPDSDAAEVYDELFSVFIQAYHDLHNTNESISIALAGRGNECS
jgi:xylulokinase